MAANNVSTVLNEVGGNDSPLQQTDRPYSREPHVFTCPLSKTVLIDPVIDIEGHTYERQFIEQWLKLNLGSPITRQPMVASQLVPNRLAKTMIESWKEIHEKYFVQDPPDESMEEKPLSSIEASIESLQAQLDMIQAQISGESDIERQTSLNQAAAEVTDELFQWQAILEQSPSLDERDAAQQVRSPRNFHSDKSRKETLTLTHELNRVNGEKISLERELDKARKERDEATRQLQLFQSQNVSQSQILFQQPPKIEHDHQIEQQQCQQQQLLQQQQRQHQIDIEEPQQQQQEQQQEQQHQHSPIVRSLKFLFGNQTKPFTS